ncbi:hypothetical protein TNCT_578641 [Trichonephila clavata]|uniref:Uncharacterized protein n=1 Tax=Trichonephila clavata TaxID=2740835 RepID=A0A8X6HWX9_TRICU|nr:hypothetical protein TNCT_578641 [Trichonephila clavata]
MTLGEKNINEKLLKKNLKMIYLCFPAIFITSENHEDRLRTIFFGRGEEGCQRYEKRIDWTNRFSGFEATYTHQDIIRTSVGDTHYLHARS